MGVDTQDIASFSRSASLYIPLRRRFFAGLWDFFLSMKSHSLAKLSPAGFIHSLPNKGFLLFLLLLWHQTWLYKPTSRRNSRPLCWHRIHLTCPSEPPFFSSPMNSNSSWLVLVQGAVVDPFSFPYYCPGSTEPERLQICHSIAGAATASSKNAMMSFIQLPYSLSM